MIIIVGCADNEQGQQTKTTDPSVNQHAREELAKIDSEQQSDFDLYFIQFNEPYKKALFTTGKKKEDKSKQSIEQAIEKWQTIEEKFIGKQPQDYNKTQDWDDDLKKVGTLLVDANDLVTYKV